MSYRFYPKREDEEYLESGRWKCSKSPSGSHHWKVTSSIDDGSEQRCANCDEVRKLERYYKDKTYPRNRGKNDN